VNPRRCFRRVRRSRRNLRFRVGGDPASAGSLLFTLFTISAILIESPETNLNATVVAVKPAISPSKGFYMSSPKSDLLRALVTGA